MKENTWDYTWKGVWFGALMAIVMAFPVAGILALVYRFPVPFAGYLSGFSAIGYAMGAVIFYGILGGFPLLAILGGLVGAVTAIRQKEEGPLPRKVIMSLCLSIDLVALFILAILDKIIGPW